MRASHRARQVVNALNVSTLAGLLVARALHARLEPGPDGLVLARDARGRFPSADAFTIGNVVVLRKADPGDALLRHEGRHASQWACCVVLFLPLYLLAAGWSQLRTGNHWSRNWFEHRADLVDGGYVVD